MLSVGMPALLTFPPDLRVAHLQVAWGANALEFHYVRKGAMQPNPMERVPTCSICAQEVGQPLHKWTPRRIPYPEGPAGSGSCLCAGICWDEVDRAPNSPDLLRD